MYVPQKHLHISGSKKNKKQVTVYTLEAAQMRWVITSRTYSTNPEKLVDPHPWEPWTPLTTRLYARTNLSAEQV